MSVQSEITRLETAKAAIKTAIEGKGVTVPDATMLDGMSELIDAIEAGADTSVEDAIITRTISGEYTNNRVTKVGNRAFFWCTKLTAVSFPLATSIDNGAFQYCSALTSVDAPLITIINSSMLYYCSKLSAVSFPLATKVLDSAFYYCSALTSVDLPLVNDIREYAFQGCTALTFVDLPLVTSISNNAFRNCSELATFVLRNTTTVCSLGGTGVFVNTPIKTGTGYIYVPDDLVDSYKAATNWSAYAAQIKPLSEYTGG